MGTSTLPDIDQAPDDFDDAQQDYFVAQKFDRDAAGNLRTQYPASAIASRFAAAWGNRVDDTLRAIQRRLRGAVPIGTNGAPETDAGALLSWNSAAQRVQLLNDAANAVRSLGVLQLFLGTGARILDRAGVIEGIETAGRGSLGLRTDNGTAWIKTTAAGNTGWQQIGSAVHREAFGFDTATSSAEVYASFTSSVIEAATSGSPRALNVWRAPIAGTVTGIYFVTESDAEAIECQFYETDGSTPYGNSANADTTSFVLGAGTGYLTEVAMNVDVDVGRLLTLGVNGTSALGEANCWLEVTP